MRARGRRASEKTPRELAKQRRREERKGILAHACEAITTTSKKNLVESAPSFKNLSNLKAQLAPARKYNKPSLLQLKEFANYLRSRSALFSREADYLDEYVSV